MFHVNFVFILAGLSVYNFVALFNVSPPFPTPIPFTHNLPKMLVASRFVQRTFFSHNYVTVDLIKIIFLIFLWVIILLLNISHTFKLWVYVYTFLSLYEPFLLVFAIDLTFLLYFPSKNTLVAFKKCLYSKIHSTCFLTFKHLIMPIVVFVSTVLSIHVPLYGISNW